MLGIGHDVFKGLVRVGGSNGRTHTTTNNGKPDPTRFWQLYHAHGKAAGVPLEAAKGLADKGDWDAAIHDLEALIAGAKT